MKEFAFKINGKDYKASVEESAEGLKVSVNNKTYSVELPQKSSAQVASVVRPSGAAVSTGALKRPATAAGVAENVSSPLPGTITEIRVKEGDKVKRGQVVIVMEAMKMANDIVAEHDATVAKVSVTLGQNVNQGDILVCLQSDGQPAPKCVAQPAPVPAGSSTVLAPLPGTIKQIKVKAGDKVQRGDVVLTMEAMKMENNICAEQAGTVKAVMVQSEQQVNQGDILVDIE